MDPLEAWLAEFAERRESGEALAPEAFAAEHPEGGERLRAALARMVEAEALFPEAGPPERIGRYRVLGEIGRGGMGRVLEVEADGRRSALKLLHVSLEHEPRALERFRREMQALQRLAHPGIVRIEDGGLHAGRPYLVMERIDGTSLAAALERARSSGGELELPGDGPAERRAARVMLAVAEAVEAAHVAGVQHRDLNPRNVLLRADGTPVVVDFGLARTEGAPTLTGSGDLLGTPAYMAPEQARGERVGPEADVFGLGVILYELVCGAPPRGEDETLALLRQAATRPLLPLRRRRRGVAPALARIVGSATAWRPAWRYRSAGELAADLARFLGGERPLARAPGLVERATVLCLRHPRALAASALVGVALAASAIAIGRPSAQELERKSRDAHHFAAISWLDGDPAGIRRAVEELHATRPEDRLLPLLAALGDGALPEGSSDPGVQAWIEGERHRRAGEHALALSCFESANALAPNVPLVMASTAVALQEAGELARAGRLFEHLAQYLSRARRLHVALAEIYLGTGAVEDALKASGIAVRLAPGHADVWEVAARARSAARDRAGAVEALDRARELGLGAARLAALEEALAAAE